VAEKKQKPALTKPVFIAMDKLEPGTRVNMHLRVESVSVIRQRERYDGGSLNRVGECIVGDEHGCVKLMAFDEQLDIIKEGAIITIRNANANVVKEHLRIEVDRWAKIEVSKEKVGKVNTKKNHSDVEYELISVRL
jgi:replication factor A1